MLDWKDERGDKKMRICDRCEEEQSIAEFPATTSYLWPKGHINICFSCIESWLDGENLNEVDRFCQQCNMAFLPNEWRKLWKREGKLSWRKYCSMYNDINYYKYDWGEQNERLIELAKAGVIDQELDELKPELIQKLRLKWGALPELDLIRLETFLNLSLSEYGAETHLQQDLLRKVARLSILMDTELQEGMVNKDTITQYDKLMNSVLKTFEKIDSNAITSVGQIVEFIERNGYKPTFYDGTPRDELDFLEQNIKEYLRDLVEGEVNLSDLFEAEKAKKQGRDNTYRPSKEFYELDWTDEGEEEEDADILDALPDLDDPWL